MTNTKQSADEIAAEEKYPTRTFLVSDNEFIEQQASKRGFLEGLAHRDKQIQPLIDAANLAIKSWGDYSPSPQSNAGKALRNMKQAIEAFNARNGGVAGE